MVIRRNSSSQHSKGPLRFELSGLQQVRAFFGLHAWTEWGQCRGCGVIYSSDPFCSGGMELGQWMELCRDRGIEWVGK